MAGTRALRDIVAIGASAGGVPALLQLARRLPRDLPAAVLLVQHLPVGGESALPQLLTRQGGLPAVFAVDGEVPAPGRIHVAPPARHLLLVEGRIALGLGPRENATRPAIDPLFRSVALCCASRAIGVVLTGTMGDGAAGLAEMSAAGAITVVQDPEDSEFPDMPRAALERTASDHVVPLVEMPTLLAALVHQPAGDERPAPPHLAMEVEIARTGRAGISMLDRLGRRSALTCPECRGALWEVEDAGRLRLRCHIGHAYSGEMVALALEENLQRALGSALRVLEERVEITGKLEHQAVERNAPTLARQWAQRRAELERELATLRGAAARIDALAREIA